MAAGEQYGQISPVREGFVRSVKLTKINKPDERGGKGADRTVTYLYCGDAIAVADTMGWTPHCEAFAAAVTRAKGTHRNLGCLRRPPGRKRLNSVEECLEQYPLLKEAGVTLYDFNFSLSKRDNFSGGKRELPQLSVQPTGSAVTAGPPTQPGTPRHAQQQVAPSIQPAAAVSPSALKRQRLVYSSSSDDDADEDEPLAVRRQRMEASHRARQIP